MKHVFAHFSHLSAGLLACGLLASSLAQAQFGPIVTYSTGAGSFPRSLAVGDVTADGRPDVVTLLGTGTALGVLAGQASGGFAAPTSYPLASGSHTAVALADLNLDGRLDALAINAVGNTVEVLLGAAGGGFGAFTAYATGPASNPGGLAVGDLNADGRPDIVTANDNSGTVGVLLGLAGGGFAPVFPYNVGLNTAPDYVALADLNGDGRLDVVTSNSNSASVGVLLGQAGGTLGAVTNYSVGAAAIPQAVALGDVNADGRPDVVVATRDANTVAVLLAQASGALAPAVQYATGATSKPSGLALADVNGDGRLDVVTANLGELNDTVTLLLGQAGGTFAPFVTFATGVGSRSSSVVLADVNADRRPDIVVLTPGTYGVPGYPAGQLVGGDAVGVLLNTGTYPLAAAGSAASQLVGLYPNPAHGSCLVQRPAGPTTTAYLLNGLGQAVRQWPLAAPETTLALHGLPPGVYTLRLLLSGEPVAKRLVLE
jgi:hypothetical protein